MKLASNHPCFCLNFVSINEIEGAGLQTNTGRSLFLHAVFLRMSSFLINM